MYETQFLGVLKEDEMYRIENLSERINSLIEFKNIIDVEGQQELLQNINVDIDKMKNLLSLWWHETAGKYQWKYDNEDDFFVDFEKHNIFLVKRGK